jgi:hypothetical protein
VLIYCINIFLRSRCSTTANGATTTANGATTTANGATTTANGATTTANGATARHLSHLIESFCYSCKIGTGTHIEGINNIYHYSYYYMIIIIFILSDHGVDLESYIIIIFISLE